MLRPQPVNRLANAMPGAVLAALGFATLVHGAGLAKAGVGIPLGIVLAFRGHRMGAETRSGSVTVLSMRRTRVIPHDAITEITDFAAIVWTARSGTGPGARSSLSEPRRKHSPALPSTTLLASSDFGSGRIIGEL